MKSRILTCITALMLSSALAIPVQLAAQNALGLKYTYTHPPSPPSYTASLVRRTEGDPSQIWPATRRATSTVQAISAEAGSAEWCLS